MSDGQWLARWVAGCAVWTIFALIIVRLALPHWIAFALAVACLPLVVLAALHVPHRQRL